MKQVCYFIAIMSVCILMGCGGKKPKPIEEERLIFQIDSVDSHTGIQRMQSMHINQEITCKGKKYNLKIDRVPTNELSAVESEMGTFAENSITVKITHENGKSLFSQNFTKKDFAAYLSNDFYIHSVLEGVVFDDVKTSANNQITLAASVSYPMTDLYIPFTIVISQDGRMTLTRNEDMGELTPMDE